MLLIAAFGWQSLPSGSLSTASAAALSESQHHLHGPKTLSDDIERMQTQRYLRPGGISCVITLVLTGCFVSIDKPYIVVVPPWGCPPILQLACETHTYGQCSGYMS